MFATVVLNVMLVLLALAPGMPRPNQPPVAVDDEVIVMNEPAYVDIRVLDNDYDPEGDALTVVAAPATEGGKTVVIKGQILRVYLSPQLMASEHVDPGDLLAQGTYLVSDGAAMSRAEWRVYFKPQ